VETTKNAVFFSDEMKRYKAVLLTREGLKQLIFLACGGSSKDLVSWIEEAARRNLVEPEEGKRGPYEISGFAFTKLLNHKLEGKRRFEKMAAKLEKVFPQMLSGVATGRSKVTAQWCKRMLRLVAGYQGLHTTAHPNVFNEQGKAALRELHLGQAQLTDEETCDFKWFFDLTASCGFLASLPRD
jgi:hypothetical protein